VNQKSGLLDRMSQVAAWMQRSEAGEVVQSEGSGDGGGVRGEEGNDGDGAKELCFWKMT
jgi:hypothetical protein